MKKLLLLLLLVTINVTAQGNPDKFRDGIKTPFTQYDELTTTQKLALPQDKGTVVYDTDLKKLQVFDGVNWVGFFNAALDTADDIIEGNTNKFLTVFERAKLVDITFDANTANTFLGIGAGDNSTGNTNVYVGDYAGGDANGDSNVFSGFDAGVNSTVNNGVIIGKTSGEDSNGDYKVIIGANRGDNSNGNGQTLVGGVISGTDSSISSELGDNITILGYEAGVIRNTPALQTPNSTAIGANTIIDKANQAAIGDAAVTELKIGETLVIDKSQIVTGTEGVLVTRKVGNRTVVEVGAGIEGVANSGHTIQYNGVDQPTQPTLNFKGAVTIDNNIGNTSTDVTFQVTGGFSGNTEVATTVTTEGQTTWNIGATGVSAATNLLISGSVIIDPQYYSFDGHEITFTGLGIPTAGENYRFIYAKATTAIVEGVNVSDIVPSATIDLNNRGSIVYYTPQFAANYTTTNLIAGGKAVIYIDTTGETVFPTVNTLTSDIPMASFEADKNYKLIIETVDGTNVEFFFVKLD